MPVSLRSKLFLLLTALMTVSAASTLALVWLTYKNQLSIEQEGRLLETLRLASSLVRDQQDSLANRRLDDITAHRNSLRTSLGMFVSFLDEYYTRSEQRGLSEQEAQRQALAAATRINASTGTNLFIFDRTFEGLAHQDPAMIHTNWRALKGVTGANALEYSAGIASRDGWDTTVLWWPPDAKGMQSKHLACVTTFAPWGWFVGVSLDYSRIEAQAEQDKKRTQTEILEALSRVVLEQSGRLFVLEAHGSSFLLSPPGEARNILENHESDLRSVLANPDRLRRYVWSGPGGRYLVLAQYLPDLEWELGVIMDNADTLLPVVPLARRQILAIFCVVAFGAAVAWFMIHVLTNPLAVLAARARRFRPLQEGDENTIHALRRLSGNHPGEAGRIAQAWADTLEALSTGLAELKAASVAQESSAVELAVSKSELERLNQELETRVSLRTAALEAANDRLRNSEARYRSLFMNSPVSFLELDVSGLDFLLSLPGSDRIDDFPSLIALNPEFADGLSRLVIVRDANPAAVEISGASTKAEMMENLAQIVSIDTLAPLRECLQKLKAGLPTSGYEVRFTTLDGRQRYCILGVRPLPGHEHTLDRVLLSVLDVTELKQGEELLRSAHEQAKSASKAKSEFLANMSHEIRTPITAILGLAELSRRNNNPRKTDTQLDMIAESARTLLAIIGDVLDLSRVEAGKLTLEKKPFDLRETIDRTAEQFRATCADKGLELKIVTPDELPVRLIGDPVRLGQILANLIGNAVKFTRAGGITVTVSESGSHPGPDISELLFRVSDTGIGIPADLTTAIFDSFRQVDSSYSKPYQGVGLGLAICRDLAELMGGTIWVESEVGKGSVFCFTARFDRAPSCPQAEMEPVPSAGVHEGSIKILIAEDNPINRHVFYEYLTSLGHEVTTAADGRQALDILAKEPHDMVFMDVQMPKLDGLEAVRRIRAGECGERVAAMPVIALTAYAMSGDRERFLEAGMTGYLAKPLSLDSLQSAIARYAVPSGDSRVPLSRPQPEETERQTAVESLMDEFITYITERTATAAAHIEAGEYGQAAKAAHDIKGTSMAFGVGNVNELGADLETAAKAEDAQAAANIIDTLRESLAQLASGKP